VEQPRPDHSDEQLQALEDLVDENASIAGDVLQVSEHLWAVHGYIAVDGDVLMGEFDSYEEATSVLKRLPERSHRTDDFL
jgi:hypothetical protein